MVIDTGFHADRRPGDLRASEFENGILSGGSVFSRGIDLAGVTALRTKQNADDILAENETFAPMPDIVFMFSLAFLKNFKFSIRVICV